jgi:hypothetical protein
VVLVSALGVKKSLFSPGSLSQHSSFHPAAGQAGRRDQGINMRNHSHHCYGLQS